MDYTFYEKSDEERHKEAMTLFCESCKFRNKRGYCLSPKLSEGYEDEVERQDMLIYSYNENGRFWVGPKFGCVHHEEESSKINEEIG